MPWMTNDISSNYKEATNLLFHLKIMILDSEIKQGSEIFLFMGNEVAGGRHTVYVTSNDCESKEVRDEW